MNSRKRNILVALFTSAFMLAGCETLQQASTNPDYAKTRRGAAYGAAAGAAVGLLTKGDKLKNAAIGAAIGGIAGGAIGNYQDRQERKLREDLAGTGVDVVRKEDNLTLNMPGKITFATDSADLNASLLPILDKVSDTLNEYGETVIEVAGHTDSTGTADYNQALSERRAKSVADYLITRGVKQPRLIIVGAGEDHPIATNDTEEGRAQNRRVELTIVPVEKKA
jgi:outer membrane protein OmpA-like peptidoglycan-associated protein